MRIRIRRGRRKAEKTEAGPIRVGRRHSGGNVPGDGDRGDGLEGKAAHECLPSSMAREYIWRAMFMATKLAS